MCLSLSLCVYVWQFVVILLYLECGVYVYVCDNNVFLKRCACQSKYPLNMCTHIQTLIFESVAVI